VSSDFHAPGAELHRSSNAGSSREDPVEYAPDERGNRSGYNHACRSVRKGAGRTDDVIGHPDDRSDDDRRKTAALRLIDWVAVIRGSGERGEPIRADIRISRTALQVEDT
jgi:hypothetical protein